MITREILLNEQARLAARREQLVADLNGVIGAEQEVAVLLRMTDKPEPKPTEPTAP